jgi:hypothetical protein
MNTRRFLVGPLVAVLVLCAACGGLPFGGEGVAEGERPPESPFTWGLIMSWTALTVGGGSAILGIWVDRDKSRPAIFAVAMSGLIGAAMLVGALQGYLDEEGAIETRANLERMLDMVEDIAAASGDPELAGLVEREGKNRRPRGKAKGKAKAEDREPPADGAAPPPEGPAPEPDPAPGAPTDGEPAPDPAAPPPEDPPAGDPPTEGKAGKGGKAGKNKAGGE